MVSCPRVRSGRQSNVLVHWRVLDRMHLDTMPPVAIAKLIPQFEEALRYMRYLNVAASNRSWTDFSPKPADQASAEPLQIVLEQYDEDAFEDDSDDDDLLSTLREYVAAHCMCS